MARIKPFIAAAVAALALGATARAADMPGSWPPPNIEQGPPPFTELMSGWYLRGDIGYGYNRVGSVDSSSPVVSEDFENAVRITVGFGYKYQWFRSDLTIDYGAPAKYRGNTANAQPQYTAKIGALTGLANFYIDLGTWSGFTPYVGGGVGASYVGTSDYSNGALPAGEVISKTQKWNFSWAGMAGIAFQVTPNWTVDVGYRYLNLGDARSGAESTNTVTTWRNLSAQEFRVGLRLLLD